MTGSSPTYSEKHPHEPEIPPVLDADGRCLVCGLELRAKRAEAERDEWKERAGYERGWLTVAEVRLREYEEALAKMRDALSRYPEMTDAEAADAAGVVAGLLFSEQGAASGGREVPDTKEPDARHS